MFKELKLYFHVTLFAAVVFAAFYYYLIWLEIPSAVNKAVADTGIFLMGWSMLLSGVCYFWNTLDKMIVYRKYLGLVGFAFALAHLILSWGAFLNLFSLQTWQNGRMWAPFAGTLAFIIFAIMAAISNSMMAKKLGGRTWKFILRTGYLAVIFVAIHVIVLKSSRWITWMQEGFQTPPSLSFLVSVFMIVVLGMRVALWIALKRKKPLATSASPVSTASVIATPVASPSPSVHEEVSQTQQ